MRRPRARPLAIGKATALRVAAIYVLLGATWIAGSNGFSLFYGETGAGVTLAGIGKDLAVVLATAVLLYMFMIRRLGREETMTGVFRQRQAQLSRYANDIVLLLDEEGRLIDANDRAADAYGFPLPTLLAMDIGQLRADQRNWREDWDVTLSKGNVRFETLHRRADGTVFPVEVSARRIDLERGHVVQSIIRDIGERRDAERQIVRLKDIYAALSQTNQCIVRVTDRRELFKTICDIAIDFGHFRMAWIGLIDAVGKTVVPAERAGTGTEFLDDLPISADPASPFNAGPTGQAAATGKPCIFNDIAETRKSQPRHQEIYDRGDRSVAAFPLFTRGRVIGTLSLYSAEPRFFTDDLVHLLDEMATDISYALDRMEAQAEHRRLELEFAEAEAQSRARLQESRDLLFNLIAQVPGLIFQYRLNPDGTSGFPFINEAANELYGLSPEVLRQDASAMFVYQHPEDAAGIRESLRKSAQTLSEWHHVYRVVPPGLGVRWRLGKAKPQKLEDGSILWHGFITDITEQKLAQERIEFLAHYDPLTRLPNRLLGKDRMKRAMALSDREKSKSALLFVNIDHFKRINDSLGQATGDAVLQAVAERLGRCIRETDSLSRQGADEFLIILPTIEDAEPVNRVATQVLQAMTQPIAIGEFELSPTVSIGISVYPDDGTDFDTVLKHAETAMDHAKEAGRNTYRFFADRMNINAHEYLQVLNGLRGAVDRGEYVLHYQPQIALASGDVVGVEALVRWNHPELGLVPPGRFIGIAEDSGLIIEIGEWVLQEACRQAVEWQRAGLPNLSMAVNLSAVQFKRDGLPQSVRRALDLSGLEPGCLELELTESILIKDTANVLATVRQLKAMGVRLSIDDFGTGYSSLAYLRLLDLDKLKIDQSFIRDIATNPNNDIIVRAVVQLAQGLGLTTIAEGVEDSQTLDIVRHHGCDEVQGFHFAKPMPADRLARYLADRPPSPSPGIGAR